jgi:hypothetical protein
VRAPVFLTLTVETRDAVEDVQPCASVAANLDLRPGRAKRVEGLVEQVADDPVLRLVAGGADVANREVVVHTHMAFDEASDVPAMRLAVEALEDQDVAPAGGTAVALAVAAGIRVGEGGANSLTQRCVIRRFGGPHSIGKASLFHGGSCRTA